MENFEPHKREIFWYNISVPHERGDLIFDIGLRTGRRRRHLFRSVCEASGLVRSRIGQNPGSAVLIQSPFRGAAETHPTPAASTQQRIGASEKTTTFYGRSENTVLRRMAIMRRNLFSYASSRLVVVPLGNRVSRVRRFSFPRRSGSTRSSRCGKGTVNYGYQMPALRNGVRSRKARHVPLHEMRSVWEGVCNWSDLKPSRGIFCRADIKWESVDDSRYEVSTAEMRSATLAPVCEYQ